MTDLKRAYDALSGKKLSYDKLFNYYDGDQPLLYTNKRLEEIFKGLDAVFVENWCAVVIDAVKDRIDLASIDAPDENSQAALDAIWAGSSLDLEADDAHEAALITGEGFIIAWPGDDGIPQAFANDPRLCHAFYRSDNPREMEFAAKWWTSGRATSRATRLTLYYPDRLEYYQANTADPSSANAFRPMVPPVADNPYSIIPVFHFRLRRRKIIGDLANVVPIQNGINKLLTDMMVAAEFGAFKQRYVISNADVTGKLKNAPNQIWSVPAGDGMGQQTSVGEFTATDLTNYLSAIDNLAQTLASITRTPKHYFLKQGGDPSGEALIAMESPLTKKAQDRIDGFTPVWQALASFLLRLAGITVARIDITPNWSDVETAQPMTQANITQTRINTGIPLSIALAWEGFTEAQIAEVEQARAAEKQSAQASLATALLSAERQFNAGPQQQPQVQADA